MPSGVFTFALKDGAAIQVSTNLIEHSYSFPQKKDRHSNSYSIINSERTSLSTEARR